MTIITTGVTGSLVARQEIRVMMLDKELFTLYILAMDRFQKTDQSDVSSYFQIAGIHGRPYVAYDGATGVGNFGGYCTHSSILFPSWHRPYLALFEQALNKHVNDIANEYPAASRNVYRAAAQRFRIPYWDWALTTDLPDVVSRQKELTLVTPRGVEKMPNPLYTYTFHPMYQDFGDGRTDERIWEAWRSTFRYPTSQDSNAQSDGEGLERTLMNNRLTVRDRTYNLLTNATSYQSFSNDGFNSGMGSTSYESLESVHGMIHGLTGRDGHMGVVDFAAFDPLFWLHHANCDRIFAMWQALNPQSYVTPKETKGGTFATKRNTIEDVNTPLAPFWRAQGVFWTSEGVRDTRTLGYTYPELVNWASLDARTKGQRIRTDINALYARTAAWGALNPGVFNVQPSVPTSTPAVSSFGATAAPAVPAVAAKMMVMSDQAPEAKVAPVAGASSQRTLNAPLDNKSAVGSSHSSGVARHSPGGSHIAAAVHSVAEKVENVVHHISAELHKSHPEYHSTPAEYKPSTGYPQPPKQYEKPPAEYQKPPTEYQKPPVEYKPTGSHAPPTGYAQPPTEYTGPKHYEEPPTQPPTGYPPPTDYEKPPTGYPPPTDYEKPPTQPPTGYPPPTDYEKPPTGYPPPTDYGKPPTGYPPPTDYEKPPTQPPTGYPPPTDYEKPPTVPPTTYGSQPPAGYTAPSDYQKNPVDTAYAGKKEYIEWIANINVEKYAAKTTFFVYIFLGDFNSDPTKWAEDPNLVGMHVIFANNMNYTGCERCRDQAEAHKLVTGTIPLTGALGDKLGKYKIGSLEPAEIIPYLKKELHWRIQTHDQRVIERSELPSLKVSVASIPVSLPENINEFPVWGEGSRQIEVTAGRPAGANPEDED